MEQTFDREQLVRYLLGDLSQDQQAALEKQYLVHDELFEELLIVENELADQYADGTLSRADRSLIEANWLSDPRRGRKIAFACDLRRHVDSAHRSGGDRPDRFLARFEGTSSWDALVRAWRLFSRRGSPAFRLVVVVPVVMLVVVIGSGLIVLNRHRSREAGVERAAPPQHQLTSVEPPLTSAERPRTEAARPSAGEPDPLRNPAESGRAVNIEIGGAARGSGDGPRTRPSQPSTVTFVLAEGLLRDVGGANEITVPRGASTPFVLRLEVGGDDHKSYETVISSVDGKEVWSQSGLRRRVTTTGTFVDLRLASSQLPPGDYVVNLRGASPGQLAEEVADFYFRLKAVPVSHSTRPR